MLKNRFRTEFMNRILVQGCKAGLVAGLIWGGLVLFFVSPLIVQAEKYEVISTEAGIEVSSEEDHTHLSGHSHSHSSLTEQDAEKGGWKRHLLTLLGTSLLGTAFGVLFAFGLSWVVYHNIISFRTPPPIYLGSLMGLLGFVIFQGIPALGLPPPLPGVIGAEHSYSARQNWWLLSVTCSTISFLVVSFSVRSATAQKGIGMLLGFVFLLFPFWIGAPEEGQSSAPEVLRYQFLGASLITNAAYWLVLGSLLFYFLNKMALRKGLVNR
jgi:cobalt transporter subunit CbtA